MLDMFVIDQPIIRTAKASDTSAGARVLALKLMSMVEEASVVTLMLVTAVERAVSVGSSTVAKWNIQ